jgi:hypothetical protein
VFYEKAALFPRTRLSDDSRTRFVLPRLQPTLTAPQRRWDCSQISQERGTRGRPLPIHKPKPCASDDVRKRVSHGTEAAPRSRVNCSAVSTETACKTLLFGPAVVLVEQLNVIFSHGGGRWPTLLLGNLTLPGCSAKPQMKASSGFWRLSRVRANRKLFT